MDKLNASFYSLSQVQGATFDTACLIASVIILLVVTFILVKTYKASKRVELKLAEFASISGVARSETNFGSKLHLIETHANEHKLNKKALGPLAKILDEYLVIVTNKNGDVVFANESYLKKSGFELYEVIGKPSEVVDSGRHDAQYWLDMLEVVKSGKAWHGEICNRTRDGEIYWTDTFVFPLSFLSDEEDGYIYFGTDITSLKSENHLLLREVKLKEEQINKVEDLLLHSEKMASLGTISAGIAHEINNPIAFVSSNIEKIEDYFRQMEGYITYAKNIIATKIPEEEAQAFKCESGLEVDEKELKFIMEDYEDLVEETNDGINRIRKIVTDLKCFAHEQSANYSPTNLHKCLNSSLNLARSELKYKVDIITELDEGLPDVLGSETQLSQVFVNLFVNAAHAIEEKGELT
ncbi:PAS domain-containing protein, partial [candidate division KSB1 bacterium]|nr:PAS domain-containing protein [candidate division KSB1 bacterium]